MSTRSPLDLKEFETILTKDKTRLQKNIDALRTELNSIGNEDEIDDIEDMAELQIDNATDQTLLKQYETQMGEVNAALERIAQGIYGICERTHTPIPLERLKANPVARTVVGC